MTLEANRIYCGDCLDIMTDIDDCSIDMILADLPYGTTNCEWDSVIPLEPLWAHYKRIIKPRGAIVLTASQPFTTCLINAAGLDWFKYEWIWEKSLATGFQHAKNAPLKIHENVLVFSSGVINHENLTDNRMVYNPQMGKGRPYLKIQRTANVGQGSMHRASKVNLDYVGTVVNNAGTRYPNSILHFPIHNHKLHPNQKPVAIFAYLIRTYSNPGDLVMDNAAGSGTTAIAAIETGRNWICIEKDAGYCQVAQERVDKRLAQPFLPTIVEHGNIDHEQAQLPLDNPGETW